jgi:hypothetical protein
MTTKKRWGAGTLNRADEIILPYGCTISFVINHRSILLLVYRSLIVLTCRLIARTISRFISSPPRLPYPRYMSFPRKQESTCQHPLSLPRYLTSPPCLSIMPCSPFPPCSSSPPYLSFPRKRGSSFSRKQESICQHPLSFPCYLSFRPDLSFPRKRGSSFSRKRESICQHPFSFPGYLSFPPYLSFPRKRESTCLHALVALGTGERPIY